MLSRQTPVVSTPFAASFHESLRPICYVQGALITEEFYGYTLSSHFQPIFGLSHQRPLGYEALLRVRDETGQAVSPKSLFDSLTRMQRKELDKLCHRLHLGNYLSMADNKGWLFLNMTTDVFLSTAKVDHARQFEALLQELDFPAHRLVIEVLEEQVRDEQDFEAAVSCFRQLGCLIALDDFGAGSSNFDRVWKLKPQIVKLDRSLIAQSAQDRHVRRLLPQMVALLHEAGVMVLIEGIETQDEACIALDADADFAQGFLFGKPSPSFEFSHGHDALVDGLWTTVEQNWQVDRETRKEFLSPYKNAIGYASVLLAAGRSVSEACASFLDLPLSDFCYLLDRDGRQIGLNEWAQAFNPDKDIRLEPLWDASGARWARSPYFRRAIENFGSVQVTRPYFSLSSARLSITVSVSFKLNGELCVICGDLRNP